MGDSDIVDTVIGLLANFIQTSSLVVAVAVFLFFSPSQKAALADRVVRTSEWAATHSFLQWLRRPAKRASQVMRRYYGARGRRSGQPLWGLLSTESWYASTHLATIYLTFGLPMFGILYLALSPSAKIGVASRVAVLSFAIIISASVWLAKLLRRRTHQRSSKEKFSIFCRTLVIGIAIPALLLNNGLVRPPDKAADPDSISTIGFVLGAISFISVTYLYTTARLLAIFRHWLPVGLCVYLVFALFVSRAATGIIAEVSGSIYNYSDLVGLLLLTVGCFSPKRMASATARNVPLVFGVVGLLLLALPLVKALYVLGLRELLTPVAGLHSAITLHLTFGIFVVTIASLVYANGMCDWLSAAFTRMLLLRLLRAKSYAQYIALLLLDVMLAVLLCVATYVVFIALTHAYYLAAQLPLFDFLHELRVFPLSLDAAIVGKPAETAEKVDLWVTLGRAVGYFVLLFSLTALAPTLFHISLTVSFVATQMISPVFTIPAKALLNRHREMRSEGDFSSKLFNYLMTYAVTMAVLFLVYLAYKLIRLYH